MELLQEQIYGRIYDKILTALLKQLITSYCSLNGEFMTKYNHRKTIRAQVACAHLCLVSLFDHSLLAKNS